MARLAPSHREARTRERTDQIVEAAVECWLEHGFDATTVDAIARHAGVGKGTVYLYFPTKQDILEAAIARYSIQPDVHRVLGAFADKPAREVIPFLVRAIYQLLVARHPVVRLLVRELALRPSHALAFIERVVLPTNDALAARLRADRTLRQDIDLFVAARSLIGMITIFVFTQDVFGGRSVRPIDDDAIVTTIADLFLNGVAARQGSPGEVS